MSKIIVIGHTVRDPEYTPANGDKKQYAKITVAEDNEYGDLTSYFDCIVFGPYADSIYKNAYKGRFVAVFGRFEQGETYTDKNGNKRRSWTLYPDKVRYLDPRRDGSSQPAAVPEQKSQTEPTPGGFDEIDEDIPF